MGTTLENGVYLPNEGERNCYAGLKTNWEILDQKVADVTALQQAVAGALHREIVESLPTTDIDPNTIYMVLSGTSATENVYNEYMYVNNAWELIGTSATDLTNYYTKGEVDGLLVLKANASDLTSHTGDTTIHVTTADKTKWNNGVSQSYVFRYSSTALVASSTNSNTLLDNTDNLKVGDKVIDSSGVLFSITAIDTANSTFTIGTALVDLATDSDVVHKSGNETVAGFKEFANIRATNSIKGINLDSTTTDLNNCYSDFASSDGSRAGNIQYYYCNTDSGTANISNLPETRAFFLTSIITRLISSSLYVKQILINSNSKTFVRYCNNSTWSSWVNETDKYVTTDTAQTISGAKTFTGNNMIKTSSPKVLLINTSQTGNTAPSSNTASSLRFDGGTVNNFGGVQCEFLTTGENRLANYVNDITKAKVNTIQQRASSTTAMTVFNADLLAPANDGVTALGSSSRRWSDCQTKLINSLTPSSLSLPSGTLADQIDISSYFANTGSGDTNSYTASANGWIYLYVTACRTLTAYIQNGTDTLYSDYRERSSDGQIRIMLPIQKNNKFTSQWITSTTVSITKAVFIPCQGNV